MPKKRVLVGYGSTLSPSIPSRLFPSLTAHQVDVDAVANWINTCDGSPQNPTNVSRGIYGATVGIDRLLKLYDKYNIKATWFTPAHSIESFPAQLAKVRDAGHEIGLHGYTHEYVSQLSATEQKKVLDRSIDVLTKFCGEKPKGYTAPSWSTSRELIPQLQEAGIAYDHSFMHHDFQPYFAPDNSQSWIETNVAKSADAWMSPMSRLKASNVVEIPANWHLDDWPPLQPIPGRAGAQGFVDTHVVERLWREQFDFAYREYESFIFPISIHPQVSGKPQVILMHERLIEYINGHEGVEWMPMCEMAKEFLEGRIEGVKVEGGVDLDPSKL
jgi:peptidoglycan/xylan/chitin deacetylase (PgdA/CDA1 family)